MVSRQPFHRSELICSDCSHPMADYLRSLQSPRSWGDLAAVGLVLAIGCSAMGLTTVKNAISGNQDDLAPATRIEP